MHAVAVPVAVVVVRPPNSGLPGRSIGPETICKEPDFLDGQGVRFRRKWNNVVKRAALKNKQAAGKIE